MSTYTYHLVQSPKIILVSGTEQQAQRVEMKADNNLVGWADFVIDNGWSKFTEFAIDENHRSEENGMAFIRAVYGLVPEPKKTFWWSATPSMKKYFDLITAERPDMTFAAGGAINRIARATA